jgi:hypothetical protein
MATAPFLLLAVLSTSHAQSGGLSPAEIDAIYDKIAAGGNITLEEMEALNNSKVAISVKKRTPLYEKPSLSSRIVDYVGSNTNYKWRCYPAAKGVDWIRCASDEYMYIGRSQ